MTKRQLIDRLAPQMGVSKAAAEMALTALTDILRKELATEGREVVIRGFGRFTSVLRPAMQCMNPRTCAPMWAPAKVRVKFKSHIPVFKGKVVQP